MADIVRRLLKRKLVTRRRNHVDKRAYVVVLSGAGEDLVAELREATERTDEALLASVPAKYRAALVESLRLISATPSVSA
jgi:DNA-binding MarR family transcriptional regulator